MSHGRAPSGRREVDARQRRRRRPRRAMAPTSRAGSPARRASTSSLGRPASSTPATIPNASRSSCTLPNTRRLAPATISPEASSTVAVVSTPPGRNVTSGAISARSPGSAIPCSTASNVSAETAIADRTGTSTVSVWRPRATSTSVPDEHAEAGGNRHVAGGRLQDQAEPDRHRHVAEQGDGVAVARRHRADALQPAQALGRLDLAPLGLVHELVERRDLIKAQRAGELRDRLGRRPRRRARTRSSAPSAARRHAHRARRSPRPPRSGAVASR